MKEGKSVEDEEEERKRRRLRGYIAVAVGNDDNGSNVRVSLHCGAFVGASPQLTYRVFLKISATVS